jgi:hypothetical protein
MASIDFSSFLGNGNGDGKFLDQVKKEFKLSEINNPQDIQRLWLSEMPLNVDMGFRIQKQTNDLRLTLGENWNPKNLDKLKALARHKDFICSILNAQMNPAFAFSAKEIEWRDANDPSHGHLDFHTFTNEADLVNHIDKVVARATAIQKTIQFLATFLAA